MCSTRRSSFISFIALLISALAWAGAAGAAPQSAEARDREEAAAFEAGFAVATKGPAQAPLIDQATLAIGAGQAFIPQEPSLRILRALGNTPNAEGLMGLVVGFDAGRIWIAVVRHKKEGYIKDDDAKHWNADELLSGIRSDVEESNKDRVERGFDPLEVIGWIEPPAYDATTHRLVWSLSSNVIGAPQGETTGVNYNTFALGRDGYFSLNLLTDSARVEGHKPIAKALLAGLAYNPGKRYEDFDSSTDQVAAYGLAALVGGLAAKKLGLLALGAAFFAKFAKIIIVAVAAIGVGISKFFRRSTSA